MNTTTRPYRRPGHVNQTARKPLTSTNTRRTDNQPSSGTSQAEHRGKRLGMAVKVPNLRSLQAGLDHGAVLHTWNAPENAPMIAVNDHLGFRAVDQCITFQRTL